MNCLRETMSRLCSDPDTTTLSLNIRYRRIRPLLLKNKCDLTDYAGRYMHCCDI